VSSQFATARESKRTHVPIRNEGGRPDFAWAALASQVPRPFATRCLWAGVDPRTVLQLARSLGSGIYDAVSEAVAESAGVREGERDLSTADFEFHSGF